MAERMPKADAIWRNGRFLTMDPGKPHADAVAVKDGRILAVGAEAEISALSGPATRNYDLRGRFAMPGLIDSHVHALWGARRDLFEVYVGYAASLDELLEGVRRRAAETAPGEWIIGGPWRPTHQAELGETPRAALDRIAPEHPVALGDVTQHSLWASSRALAIAGIDRETPDPADGKIERDANREPTGVLHESAAGAIRSAQRESAARMAAAATYVTETFHRLGITGFKEPMAFEADLAAYCDADRRGGLRLNATCCLTRQSPIGGEATPYGELRRWRADYATGNVRTDGAKLFLDGVAPSFTASFLEPYVSPDYDAARHDPEALLIMPPARIAEEVIALDAMGFTVKMHAVGDGAVRAGLDAIEAARRANGDSGLRHELAHCGFIADDDLPRFAALGAVAEVSPKMWFPNPVTAGQIAVLGEERTQRCHRIRSLLDAGAEVTYGSDWPAAAPDPDPWIGLSGMLTRRDPTGRYPGAIGPGEAISLTQALRIFTVNGARALGRGGEIGMLKTDHSADFIVLDRDIETAPAEAIAEVEVRKTIFKGEVQRDIE